MRTKSMKRSVCFLVGLALFMVSFILPGTNAQAAETVISDIAIDKSSVVVLYTNDIHGGLSNNEGYSGSKDSLGLAGVAVLRAEAKESAAAVTVVDVGDALQGTIVCSQSDGADMLQLMNQTGYDYLVAGNHEFDYGMERLLELPGEAKGKYLAVNFTDLRTGEPVWKPYDLVSYETEAGPIKVAYLGIMTPENITKGSVSNFQDEDENFIYGFYGENLKEFYQVIQDGIDDAYENGADLVIALGHLGDTGVTEGWSSVDVISNTRGIRAFIDGHAHSNIEEQLYKDLDGTEVILTSTGTKLSNIGALVIEKDKDGKFELSTHLVNQLTDAEKKFTAYQETETQVNSIQENYAKFLVVEGKSDYDLCIYQPESKERLIRKQETNLGDFVTDAFRYGLEADVAFSNGGNIRADLPSGEITYLDIMNVLPWSSNIVKLEVTGQQLLDCLEMGARLWPEECGGFIQTSGLTYEIDTEKESTVVTDEAGLFERVEGEYRVGSVYVGGEPLDLKKTYTLAIDEYYYQSDGDGMTMFKDCKALVTPEDAVIDHDLVIKYLDTLDGEISSEYELVDGQGRISIVSGNDVEKADYSEGETVSKPNPIVRTIVSICLIGFLTLSAWRLFSKKN